MKLWKEYGKMVFELFHSFKHPSNLINGYNTLLTLTLTLKKTWHIQIIFYVSTKDFCIEYKVRKNFEDNFFVQV